MIGTSCGYNPLHRPDANPEFLGDLLNARAVLAPGPYSLLDFRVYSRPAQLLALRHSPRQPGPVSILDHRPLELGKDAHRLKHRLAGWSGGVYALQVQIEIDPLAVQLAKVAD